MPNMDRKHRKKLQLKKPRQKKNHKLKKPEEAEQEQAAADHVERALVEEFGNMKLDKVVREDVERVEGRVVCRSTYDNEVRGVGWIDDDTYVSNKTGIAYDTAQPPPQRCFNCGAYHWRRDCPFRRNNR